MNKNVKDAGFILSHYIRRSPSALGWVKIGFITQKISTQEYYLGFNTDAPLGKDLIESCVNEGSWKELKGEVPIKPTQALWLTPSKNIYIADAQYPVGERIFLEKIDS